MPMLQLTPVSCSDGTFKKLRRPPHDRLLLERVLESSHEFGESWLGCRSAVMNHHKHLRALAAHERPVGAAALGSPTCQSLGETRRDLVVHERPPLALAYGSCGQPPS